MYDISILATLDDISAEDWNALLVDDYPFIRYEFLIALERSEATCKESGWEPHHIQVRKHGAIVAVMPCYLKHHSYGEYVFDFEWAAAYQRHGLVYYPKLVSAIPFTPATGTRLCVKEGESSSEIIETICATLTEACATPDIASGIVTNKTSGIASDMVSGIPPIFSSFHLLFPQQALCQEFSRSGLMDRVGVQYHWFNHDYKNFDDFLSSCTSRKRKSIKKERARVEAQNIDLTVYEGADITQALWQKFYWFYQMTYAKRSGHGGYLSEAFFHEISETLAANLILVMASHDDEIVAGSLFFKDSDTLYGRYWGCIKDFEMLHFEACYYQGIEYCIRHKLSRFDPGAQGEHKIQRGFVPIKTYSNHWIRHPEFSVAIEKYLQSEKQHINEYIDVAKTRLPFKAC